MTWTKDAIKELLKARDEAVERAVVAIYRLQTEDEKLSESTTHHNARGFNAFHAGAGSYYAKWVLAGRRLTGNHLEKARRMMMHYVGQLFEVACQRRAQG